MREIVGGLVLAALVGVALMLLGAPIAQVAADAMRPAMRLLVAASVGFAVIRVACGPHAQMDEAIRGTGAYAGAPPTVRGRAVLGIALVLAAALIAAGSVL